MTDGGNVYDKYGTTNPIERRLVERFLESIEALARRSGAAEAHEVGCGEGEVSMWLAERVGLTIRGSDISPEVIVEARSRAAARGLAISFEARSLTDLEPNRDSAELIVCCEVMEHLPDPDEGLDRIAALASPWALISVPREPLWRALNLARGAYLRELGNTPGHLNHWSRSSLRRFLERRFDVVEMCSPLPWTAALCRTRTH